MPTEVHFVLRSAFPLAVATELDSEFLLSPSTQADVDRALSLDPHLAYEILEYVYKTLGVIRGLKALSDYSKWLRNQVTASKESQPEAAPLLMELDGTIHKVESYEDAEKVILLLRKRFPD